MREIEDGYVSLDTKPFTKYINKEKGILKYENNNSELRMPYLYHGKHIDGIYVVDGNKKAVSLFRFSNFNTSYYDDIVETKIIFNEYFRQIKNYDKIKHFNIKKSKIKEIVFENDGISDLFKRKFFNIEKEFEDGKDKYKIRKLNLNYEKKEKELLGTIKSDNNNVSLYTEDILETFRSFSKNKIELKVKIRIILEFEKPILYKEFKNFVEILEITTYLITLIKKRYRRIFLTDSKDFEYIYVDIKRDLSEDVELNGDFMFKEENINYIFIKVFENVYKMYSSSINTILPFIDFEIERRKTPIEFLENYRTLEYIKKIENKDANKGKNTNFLIEVLEEYSELKKEIFREKENKELEEEIRSLRNYFSHEGYYISELSIPTKNPKRKIDVTYEWFEKIYYFIDIILYIEMYKKCGVFEYFKYDINELKNRIKNR